MRLRYIVCFDIENDKVRQKVSRALLKKGNRVQYSVFEILFYSDSELQKLKRHLNYIIEESAENERWDIRFYYLNTVTLARSTTLDNKPVGEFPAFQSL